MIFRFSVLLACVAMTASQTFAGIIITVSSVSPTYLAGSTNAGLNVFANTDGGTQDISGFDLKFDLQSPGGGNVGLSLPPGITFSAGFITNPLLVSGGGFSGTSNFSNSPANALRDIYINGDGITTIGTAQTRLFTLNFDIGSGVAPGNYDLRFVTNQGAFGVYDTNGDPVAPATFNSGSLLVVSAVPEPSSMALLGLVFASAAGIRHRFRKKVQA